MTINGVSWKKVFTAKSPSSSLRLIKTGILALVTFVVLHANYASAANPSAIFGNACASQGMTQINGTNATTAAGSEILACLGGAWNVTMPPLPTCVAGEALGYDPAVGFECVSLTAPYAATRFPSIPNTTPQYGTQCGTNGMTQMTTIGTAIYTCVNNKWSTSLPPMPTCGDKSGYALTSGDGIHFVCAQLTCNGNLTYPTGGQNGVGGPGAQFGGNCGTLGATQLSGDNQRVLSCLYSPYSAGNLPCSTSNNNCTWQVSLPQVPKCQVINQVLSYSPIVNGGQPVFHCVNMNCGPTNGVCSNPADPNNKCVTGTESDNADGTWNCAGINGGLPQKNCGTSNLCADGNPPGPTGCACSPLPATLFYLEKIPECGACDVIIPGVGSMGYYAWQDVCYGAFPESMIADCNGCTTVNATQDPNNCQEIDTASPGCGNDPTAVVRLNSSCVVGTLCGSWTGSPYGSCPPTIIVNGGNCWSSPPTDGSCGPLNASGNGTCASGSPGPTNGGTWICFSNDSGNDVNCPGSNSTGVTRPSGNILPQAHVAAPPG